MKHWPVITAVCLTLGYAIFFSWFTIGRHNKTNSTRFDLGNVEQTIWNSVHGRIFQLTDPYGVDTVSRFAFHADPFLLVAALPYAVFPYTATLLVFQAAVVASGALALFLIGKKYCNEKWGVLFAALYVINPSIAWSTIFDWHAVTFATPLVLWTAWAAGQKRYRLMVLFAVLAIMTKEQVGLMVAAIAGWAWWRDRHARWPQVIVVTGLVWMSLAFLVIIPHFRSQTDGGDEVYRGLFGNTASSIITTAAIRPVDAVKVFFDATGRSYMTQVLLPIGGVSLLSPWSLVALPDIFINLSSLKPAQHAIVSHYTGATTPWLFIGAVMGVAWLQRRWSYRRPWLAPALALWLIISGGYAAWAYGPLPGARQDHRRVVTWRNNYADPVRAWSQSIPTNAAVSVTNNIGSHFARREHFYSFPLGVNLAEYVVVLEGHATPVVESQANVSLLVENLRRSSEWDVLESTGDLTVLRRRP